VVGFGVAFKSVLWSPVGAPAGVPGPRRNADECDAGWFAPVATRRRPNLRRLSGAFAKGSQSPRADDPRWVLGHASPPLAVQPLVGAPRAPEGRFGSPDPVSCRHVPPRFPSPLPHLAGVRTTWPPAVSRQLCRSSHARRTGVPRPEGLRNLQPVACVLRNQAERRRSREARRYPSRCAAGGGSARHGVLSVPS
jgi:hypothetical protein